MELDKELEDEVRYFLCMGDEDEAIKVLEASGLDSDEARAIVKEAEPMTITEAYEYIAYGRI